MAEDKTLFGHPEFKKYKKAWDARQKVLLKRRSYYDGTMYGEVNDWLGWLKFRVGKEIKPLFLGLSRAVDVDAGIIPGKWKMGDESISESLIAQWEDARDVVFNMSGWKTDGVLFVHYGAQYGIVGLKVSHSGEGAGEKWVKVKPVDPLNFMLVNQGINDDSTAMSIYLEKRTIDGDEVEYAEVITPTEIRTFLNGTEMMDENGEEWTNTLQAVPYFEVRHIETGDALGEPTYAKAMPLLDEVNEHASELSKIIKDNAEPQWAVIGAEPSELTHSGDNVWFIPEGGSVQILLPPVDIEGILAFIKEIKEGTKEALPELSFDELRSKDQIAAETLGLQLLELVIKVQRIRPNYDVGLVKALRLAGKAGELIGLAEVTALNDDALVIDEDREILPLDPETRMKLEMMEIELDVMRNGTDPGEAAE